MTGCAKLFVSLLWISCLRHLQAAESDVIEVLQGPSHLRPPSGRDDDRPGMQVVVRQALLDYGTTVGITALSSHIHDISIADVNTTLRVPVVGAVALSIKDIKCLHFTEPRELAKLQISNGSFYASSKSLSAKFKYKWSWESQSLPLDGAGEGSIDFDAGDITMHFSVFDSDRPQLRVENASISFDDIKLKASGSSLSWLYNAMLALFHDQIVTKIEDRMSVALLHDVPAKLNSYLTALPSTVVIRGLPISAAFRYAIYTHDFIVVRAFPIVGASPAHSFPPAAPSGAAARSRAQLQGAESSSGEKVLSATAGAEAMDAAGRRLHAEIDGDRDGGEGRSTAAADTDAALEAPAPLRSAGDALAASWGTAWRRWRPLESAAVADALAGGVEVEAGGQKCPASSSRLNVSDAEMGADSHMATLFMNDAVPQCLLWALHRRGLLHVTVQDGDVPGIRLLTDLFAVLIPGVQVDYPHRSIALSIAATAEPAVAFLPGKGARIAGSYETHVFVLPTGGDMHDAHAFGELPDGAVEVAVLETELSGVVDLQFKRSKVSDLEVKYTVKQSQYKINPWTWEATITYVVGQAQASIGVKSLWDKFVAHGVVSALHAQHALGTYLPGWFQLSVDFLVDLD